jgi:hypothetical protein
MVTNKQGAIFLDAISLWSVHKSGLNKALELFTALDKN